jgi:hypothetical protein
MMNDECDNGNNREEIPICFLLFQQDSFVSFSTHYRSTEGPVNKIGDCLSNIRIIPVVLIFSS